MWNSINLFPYNMTVTLERVTSFPPNWTDSEYIIYFAIFFFSITSNFLFINLVSMPAKEKKIVTSYRLHTNCLYRNVKLATVSHCMLVANCSWMLGHLLIELIFFEKPLSLISRNYNERMHRKIKNETVIPNSENISVNWNTKADD